MNISEKVEARKVAIPLLPKYMTKNEIYQYRFDFQHLAVC